MISLYPILQNLQAKIEESFPWNYEDAHSAIR